MTIRVIEREENYTVMETNSTGQTKAFVRQLVRDGKAFDAAPVDDDRWTIKVYEYNHPKRWEYA